MVMTTDFRSNDDRWMSTRQAAAYLGYALQTIYNKVEDGMPVHRIGRTLKFRKSELDEWVRDQSSEAAA